MEENFQIFRFSHTNPQASVLSPMIKLVGNDIIVLCVFLQVSLLDFTHLLWHYIGSHILYHGFSPLRCNRRHLLESDCIYHCLTFIFLTSTLSNVVMHILVHGRLVDPHSLNSLQTLFWREVHIADSNMSTFQVWNCYLHIYTQPHDWISIFFPL